jgi:muramoyltetrapeptide carboxypeptidase
MAKMVFPPVLKPGGTIGLVSPARWPQPKWIDRCQTFLQKRGYKVKIHPQNYLQDGQLAGSDEERTQAIADSFADTGVDAILCTRGGANAIRIVDRLDYDLIKRNPKPFIGFSDISLLLNAITKHCGFVTYHGPMAWNFAHGHDPRTADDLFQMIGAAPGVLGRRFTGVDAARTGKATGNLIGGNLTRLELLMGTAYDWSAENAILFIEDVDEVIYKLDEKMHHLRLAGRLDGVKAVIVGEMVDIGDGETGFVREGERPYGKTVREIMLENLPSDIPLCFDFPCGHGKYLTTLPLGAKAELVVDSLGAELSVVIT